MSSSPRAKAVHFDDRYLHVELVDRRIVSTPLDWYPELRRAPIAVVADYRLICRGTGIEWPSIDYQLSVEGMLLGVQAGARAA
ncbi:MAG: DUF2442 domain-containing protein [Myxococcota bacterium]